MMCAKIFETHLAAFCNKISRTIKISQRHFVAFFQGLKDASSSINKRDCGTGRHVSNFCLRIVLYSPMQSAIFTRAECYRTVVTQYRTVDALAILYSEYSTVDYFDLPTQNSLNI